jgi:hypothetical protein
MLNGGALLLVLFGVSMNALGAGDHSLGEPLNTLRFVLTLIGLVVFVACAIGVYSLNLTVRYVDTKMAAGAPRESSK